MEKPLRINSPNWNLATQINQTGIGVINLFTGDLFDIINQNLIALLGTDWQSQMQSENGEAALSNFLDPSVLLKDLGRKINPTLRLPLNSKVLSSNHFQFYNLLDDIHGERHLWIHQEIEPTRKNLQSLLKLIASVSEFLELEVGKECKFLLESADLPVAKTPEVELDSKSSLLAKSDSQNASGEKLDEIGLLVTGPYLDHTYTLHLSGEIRDRDTNVLLSDVNPNSEEIGTLLISRKPTGGRIRLMPTGILAAYFDDHWGYLAKVEEPKWFPGHL